MKKDDMKEVEDVIIDDDVLDDEEVIDDEIEELDETDKVEDAPRRAPRAQNGRKQKKGITKGAKIAIISSSAAVGVIAITLVVLFVILPLIGINVFGGKKIKPYYDPTTSYGLYFYSDTHAATNADMSSVDMIRAKEGMTKTYFDPSKPTIIWFHGWEPTGSVGDRYLMAGADTVDAVPGYDCSYVQELKEKGYNVATFQFQGVKSGDKNYAKGLSSIYKYTVQSFDKGDYSLSFMFASEILKIFGEDYAKDITFVGHSCGGFVSTATNYMLQYFYKEGFTSNKHLIASRMVVEDPYVDFGGDKLDANTKLMGTNEVIGDRSKCVFVQDMMTSLHTNSNVAIDVYLGMSGASDSFIATNTHFSEVKKHVVITDMTGLKEWLGTLGKIHVVTRDWVWRSMLSEKLEDQDGSLAPSAACTNAEILSMVGNLYQQTNNEFDLSTDSLLKVDDTSGFKY